MKMTPKHFRLLSIIEERGTVPSRLKPIVREELVISGLVEYVHGEDWLREKDRYRLTNQGHKLINEHNEKVLRDNRLASQKATLHGLRKKKNNTT